MIKTIQHSSTILALFAFVLTIAFAAIPGCAAQNSPLQITASSKTTIVLPTDTIPSEETAAKELQHYLTQITGSDCKVVAENAGTALQGTVIYVGPTQFAKAHLTDKSTFADEEWTMQTSGNALILDGGRPRGTLYAVYHFLEDVAGVRWWTPFEETVPTAKVLSIANLNRREKPSFRYRDIYSTYANDGGRFMARMRLDRQGDAPVDAAYGGSRDYGPPYHVHTFFKSIYIDPEKYYPAHPDWFLIQGDGPPTVHNAQLAMSNPEMRKEFLRLLLINIRESRAVAIAKHLPVPDVYDISQNDNRVGFMGPGDEQLVKENGGAESAILLSFINYLADGIKTEFPDVYLDTLAYFSGEQAPTKIKARDNVIIRLTDTQSNVLLPITAERNHAMRENIENWAKQCKNLRVWDYDITYRFPQLPQPTAQTYQPDLQFLHAHNVEGMFIEFEHPLDADMRDMKMWVLCKLLENPNQNYEALVKEFTDGYYGAAGPYVRQYQTALQTAAAKSGADIQWFAGLDTFTYLTPDFLHQADGIYAKAANAVKSDPVLSRRVAQARASVDIAILRRFRQLMKEWRLEGHDESTFTLDRQAAGKRYLAAMNSRIDMWLPKEQQDPERLKLQNLVNSLTSGPAYLPPPAKFKDVPAKNLFTYNAADTRNYQDRAKVVVDKDAESGYATRYEIPDSEMEKYKLPMQWGVYDTVGKKTTLSGYIKATDIPSAGYHWYKLGDVTLTGHDYIFFTWSWLIQSDIVNAFDAKTPDAKYEVWADLKFDGPAFPFAKAGDKNAIGARHRRAQITLRKGARRWRAPTWNDKINISGYRQRAARCRRRDCQFHCEW
mgnify:CR=1 FL=1